MADVWVVSRGIDTLVLNVFYVDERGVSVKRDLDEELRLRLEEWKKEALGLHDDIATKLSFNGRILHMCPNGAGRGQWPWMLKTSDITLYVSGGHWNGVASVRLSSQYLWSSPGLLDTIRAVQSFVDGVFGQEMYLQVSHVDLCADVAGWADIGTMDRGKHFVTRSRKGAAYDESGLLHDVTSRNFTMGLRRTGFDFGRGGKEMGSLSCRIYEKTRELEKSGKDWFLDLWRWRGWTEAEGEVWRVEFSFKREALHELRQKVGEEVLFHGIEDAYDLPERLPVMWAYAVGQVEGGADGLPDGWLRCVVPNEDKNRSRWPTHPAWKVIQRAFLEDVEIPPQFGEIVRKRWERCNINDGIAAVVGYLSSLAAWAGGELAEDMTDLSMVLHWFALEGEEYLKRVDRDFAKEIRRKRAKFGVALAGQARERSAEDERAEAYTDERDCETAGRPK